MTRPVAIDYATKTTAEVEAEEEAWWDANIVEGPGAANSGSGKGGIASVDWLYRVRIA